MLNEIISLDGLRYDNRRPNEGRSIKLAFGVLPDADGSCRFEQGGTVVIAGIYGPHNNPGTRAVYSHVDDDGAIFRCSGCNVGRPRFGGTSPGAPELARFVIESLAPSILLKRLQRSCIELFIDVLCFDGGVLAAATNAAAAALVDAAIPMLDVPGATMVAMCNGTPLVDPDTHEAKQMAIPLAPPGVSSGVMPHATAVFLGTQVLSFVLAGPATREEYRALAEYGRDVAADVAATMKAQTRTATRKAFRGVTVAM